MSVLGLIMSRCAMLTCVAVIAVLPAFGQGLGGGESVDIPVRQILIGLLLSIASAYLILIVIKRRISGSVDNTKLGLSLFGNQSAAPEIQVLESRRVTSHASVVLVSALGRRFLICVNEGSTTLLAEDETLSVSAVTPEGGKV